MQFIRVLLFITLLPLSAAAEEKQPVRFVHQYTPTVRLVLDYDVCDKQDPSAGYVAHAEEGEKRAYGCWRRVGNVVQIWIDSFSPEEAKSAAEAEAAGVSVPYPHRYIDYSLYYIKFTPEYE